MFNELDWKGKLSIIYKQTVLIRDHRNITSSKVVGGGPQYKEQEDIFSFTNKHN